MSDTTTATPPVPPPDAGLPAGGPAARSGGQRRTGDELITAAARGEAIDGDDASDLLDYFLSNGSLPGDDDPIPVEFEIGEGRGKRKNIWKFRRIGWDEWTDAESRGRDEKTGMFDGFVVASFVVARALVSPQLGPGLQRMQKADPSNAPEDSPALLRRMFGRQAGTLLSLSSEVRRISRLGSEQISARTLDEEVAAGEA